jgi:hypothetical protein
LPSIVTPLLKNPSRPFYRARKARWICVLGGKASLRVLRGKAFLRVLCGKASLRVLRGKAF